MEEIEKLRDEIDEIDERILDALTARRKLAREMMQAKNRQGAPIRDTLREERKLGELVGRGSARGLDSRLVTHLFHHIIDDSVRCQQLELIGGEVQAGFKRIAFQGIEGAYSELAGQKYFAPFVKEADFVGCPTFEQVVDAVEDGEADYGILPVENTTAGSINEVYDLLSSAQLSIVGEEVLRIEHCLIGLADASPGGIRRVLSHPQALAQCMKFLSRLPDCLVQPYADTAMAVKKVKEENDPALAAVASEESGRLYGLKVLRRNIEDQQHNYTRFVIVAQKPQPVELRIPCKTSVVMTTSHEEGALLKALSLLHDHRINLTKLESRPIPGLPFQYLFYLDFEGNSADQRIASALEGLRLATTSLKILGSYPSTRRTKSA